MLVPHSGVGEAECDDGGATIHSGRDQGGEDSGEVVSLPQRILREVQGGEGGALGDDLGKDVSHTGGLKGLLEGERGHLRPRV